MSYAFEITLDDIQIVFANHNISLSDQEAAEVLDVLDLDAVESAALIYDDMNDQTDAAHREIEKQAINDGHLPGPIKLSP